MTTLHTAGETGDAPFHFILGYLEVQILFTEYLLSVKIWWEKKLISIRNWDICSLLKLYKVLGPGISEVSKYSLKL